MYVHKQADKNLISIQRWGEFTKESLRIADRSLTIIEIAGNDEIVVSVLTRKYNTIFRCRIALYFRSRNAT